MKRFNTQHNIGQARYVVNHHDGQKAHKDGSRFFDIAIFSNKRQFNSFRHRLKRDGYTETN